MKTEAMQDCRDSFPIRMRDFASAIAHKPPRVVLPRHVSTHAGQELVLEPLVAEAADGSITDRVWYVSEIGVFRDPILKLVFDRPGTIPLTSPGSFSIFNTLQSPRGCLF